MTLCIDLPDAIETSLRQQVADLNQAATEACLVEFYRQSQLTHCQLAEALGLDRYAVDGVLKRHGVADEMTMEELKQQVAIFSENR